MVEFHGGWHPSIWMAMYHLLFSLRQSQNPMAPTRVLRLVSSSCFCCHTFSFGKPFWKWYLAAKSSINPGFSGVQNWRLPQASVISFYLLDTGIGSRGKHLSLKRGAVDGHRTPRKEIFNPIFFFLFSILRLSSDLERSFPLRSGTASESWILYR